MPTSKQTRLKKLYDEFYNYKGVMVNKEGQLVKIHKRTSYAVLLGKKLKRVKRKKKRISKKQVIYSTNNPNWTN